MGVFVQEEPNGRGGGCLWTSTPILGGEMVETLPKVIQ